MVRSATIPDDSCWYTRNNGMIRNVARHYRARTDQRILTDRNPPQDRRVTANGRIRPDTRRQTGPVVLRLQSAVGIYSARVSVIDEHDTVADKHAVFDGHAGAQKRMARDLAVRANLDVFLNFHEWTDARSLPDRTPVDVHEIGLVNDDTLTQLHVGTNHSRGSILVTKISSKQ